jgi:hypothetical protein
MKIGTYDKSKFCDKELIDIMRLINDKITKNDDDCLLLNIGVTGSGKSTLSALQYSILCEIRKTDINPNNIVLTKMDFADSIGKLNKVEKKDRVIIYDELELSKRNSMTKWNKEIMGLYFKIRGLNCLHIWNHPSLEMVDKAFIQEKINGVFFIIDKHKDKPRRYLFFRKKDILALLGKHKKLHLEVLKEHGREYAFYMGFFGKYDGVLMERYRDIKESGMNDAIKAFQKKYGVKKERKKTIKNNSELPVVLQ